MMHRLTAIADRAKCAGIQCAYKHACGRYMRPQAENQTWASFYALGGDDCDYFETITITSESDVSDESN